MERTFNAKPDEVSRTWFVVDAANKPLGRLASDIARVLRGKHKPTYTPHVDTGDFVVVLNARQVALTGTKLTTKFYHQHSTHPGGLTSRSAAEMLAHKPEFLIEKAVRGMLPKNSLGRHLLGKLKVYPATEHPHAAQQPKTLPAQF
jgi:large subunit ribosomal protein L13